MNESCKMIYYDIFAHTQTRARNLHSPSPRFQAQWTHTHSIRAECMCHKNATPSKREHTIKQSLNTINLNRFISMFLRILTVWRAHPAGSSECAIWCLLICRCVYIHDYYLFFWSFVEASFVVFSPDFDAEIGIETKKLDVGTVANDCCDAMSECHSENATEWTVNSEMKLLPPTNRRMVMTTTSA